MADAGGGRKWGRVSPELRTSGFIATLFSLDNNIPQHLLRTSFLPMSDPSQAPAQPAHHDDGRKGGNTGWLLLLLPIVLLLAFRAFCGFYTVQPIGAIPEGRTLIVWRAEGEPFFNSPDAFCLERTGGVSLLCRGMALGRAPLDRIVLRFPYMHWAYTASTGGREFDR